jgi:hypothetical protein
MYALDIAGRAVAVTDADADQARELFTSDEFKEDLRSMRSEGLPLWDGRAPLNVRPASDEEVSAFEGALADDSGGQDTPEEDMPVSDGHEEDEDAGLNVLFLVAVNQDDDGLGSGPAS